VLDPEYTTELVWDMSMEYDYVDELLLSGKETVLSVHILEIGFDTFNPILNVGGLFVLFSIMGAQMAIALVVSILWILLKKLSATLFEGGESLRKPKTSVWEKIKKVTVNHISSLLINSPLVLLAESLVQVFVAALIHYNLPREQAEKMQQNMPATYNASSYF